MLVSYGGSQVERPLLRARLMAHRLPAALLEEWLWSDLRLAVRRSGQIGVGESFNLAQVETALLGVERRSGPETAATIADRWSAWATTVDAATLTSLVEDNQLDLCVSMVLAAHLARTDDDRHGPWPVTGGRYRLDAIRGSEPR